MQDSKQCSMGMKKYAVMDALVFFGILLGMFMAASVVFYRAARTTRDEAQLRRNASEVQLLKERENSIDVLVLGDSEAYTSISPMQVWKTAGIPVFVAAQAGQTASEMYHMFQIAMEHQKPRVLLIETHALLHSRGSAYAVQNIMLDRWGAFLPIFRYHDLWKQLVKTPSGADTSEWKGFQMRTGVRPCTELSSYMKPDSRTQKIPSENRLILSQMKEYCDANGIRMILYSAPSPVNYNYQIHNGLEQMAAAFGVSYFDLNLRTGDLGIDWSSDTVDGGDHLNLAGAEKTTRYLLDQLQPLQLADRRGDGAYASWNALSGQYTEKAAVFQAKKNGSRDSAGTIRRRQSRNNGILSNINCGG